MKQKSIVFSAALRGFHVYKMSWKSVEGEILECLLEENNPYIVLSIKYANDITHKVSWDIFQWRYQGLLNSYYKEVQEYKQR